MTSECKKDRPDSTSLAWLAESRNKNQTASLKLYKLFEDYPTKFEEQNFSIPSQVLVGVAFSLWRAAFLADKSGDTKLVQREAESFLGKMILDNAITYPQDRLAREWTFNYYMGNATYRLELLSKRPDWPDLKSGLYKFNSARDRWEKHGVALEQGIGHLESLVQSAS